MSMQVMQLVCQIQEMSAGISEIHGIGDEAIHIMELLQKQKKLAHASPSGKLPVRHLILLDRSTDFTSLFVTPLTYEGLVDEVSLSIASHVAAADPLRYSDGVRLDDRSRRSRASLPRSATRRRCRCGCRTTTICFRSCGTRTSACFRRSCSASSTRRSVVSSGLSSVEESMQAASEGKTFSKADAFDQLQIHQGLSDAVTATTNGYLFRQQWQMEHEILAGENLLDYIVERVTLQDSLLRVTRFLCLFSLVNGGLRAKDFDTVRKELVQVAAETRWHVDLRLRDAALPAPPRGRTAPRPTRARPQLQRAAQQAAAGEGRERGERGGDAVGVAGDSPAATSPAATRPSPRSSSSAFSAARESRPVGVPGEGEGRRRATRGLRVRSRGAATAEGGGKAGGRRLLRRRRHLYGDRGAALPCEEGPGGGESAS